MNANEVYEILSMGAIGTCIAAALHAGAMLVMNMAHEDSFSRRIESRRDLEKVVGVEATKLGLDKSLITSEFDAEIHCARKKDNKYLVCIQNDCCGTIAMVRHELYHVKKDLDKGKRNFLHYYFIREPRALLYGAFGIKI